MQGGVLAIWATIPIEKIQQRLATESKDAVTLVREVYARGGLRAFWAGVDVLTVMQMVEKAVYYFCMSKIRDIVRPTTLVSSSAVAYAADLCRLPFTSPLEIVASRMMKKDVSAGTALTQVLSEGGPLQLWAGTEYFLFLGLRNGLTQGIFETLKPVLIKRGFIRPGPTGALPFASSFAIAAFASTIARLIVYPVFRAFVVKKSGGAKGRGPFKLISDLYGETNSLIGMYKGIIPELIRGVTFQAILLSFVEVATPLQQPYFQ